MRVVTWDDWRLASMSVASGVPTGSVASVVDCSTATELACRDNELGYMFYQNLGGTLGDNLTGNQSPFTNIADFYWSGTEFAPFTGLAWIFIFNDGSQGFDGKNVSHFAWAVHSGDVSAPAAIPEPSTMLLMGSGLVGLMAWRRLRRG